VDKCVKYQSYANAREEGQTVEIVVNSKELESVTQFCYLGSMVTEDCRSECGVRHRIALAKEAFNKKKDLMCGSLSLQLKKRIEHCMEVTETWTLQKNNIKRIEEEEDSHRQLCPFRGSSPPFGALSWRGLDPIKLYIQPKSA